MLDYSSMYCRCLNLILVNPIPNLPQKTKSSDLSRHGYDEDPKGKMTSVSTFDATRLRQLWRTILSDEFEWQAVDKTTKQSKMSKLMYTRFTKLIIDHFLSCTKSIPRKLEHEMHSEGQDLPLIKLTNTIKAVEKPEEQYVSPVKSGRGKGYIRLGYQEVNVPSAFKKNVVPRKTRSLIVADNIIEEPVV
ncbi:hypothetical protein Tco_1338249 [Tanacetum coccineum]